MKIIHNVGTVDRVIRFILAEVTFLLAFFWTGGVTQKVFYVLSFVMAVTSLTRFCGLYIFFGGNTCAVQEKPLSRITSAIFGLLLILLPVLGSYYSIFFTKKIFLEEYTRMNQYYKQTLFFTGQNNRSEAVANYAKLTSEYDYFYKKYTNYQPYVIRGDKEFLNDISRVATIITSLQENVATGDLPLAHKEFEMVRPIFQDILKRNGFSMLSVYLVDFHDAMEKILEKANAKDASGVIAVYQEVSDKLQAVEQTANDTEIQTIRQNLDAVLELAKKGQVELLPNKATELKSSFVKVYLKRG